MRRAAMVVATAVVAAAAPAVGAGASPQTDSVEGRLLQLINQGRSGVGKGPQVMHSGLRVMARDHSAYQSSIRSLTHQDLARRIASAQPDPYESNGPPDDGFRNYCENVAYYYPGSAGATDEQVAQKLYSLWYNSGSHRNCMFDSSGHGLNVAGVGIHLDGRGYWWATFDSVRDLTPPASASAGSPGSDSGSPGNGSSGGSDSGSAAGDSSDWVRVEQSSAAVIYSGSWSTYSSPEASGGNYVRSTQTGSYARFRFQGKGVRWIGALSPAGGIAELRLDGIVVATIDQYSSTEQWRRVLFERSGLRAGAHTLEVRVRGTRNSSSKGVQTFVDAFERLP